MQLLPLASTLAALLFVASCRSPRVATGTTPSVGQEAPALALTSNDGTEVDLASLRGRWVVLYFYPKDFTGGCTLEAQNFQRDLARYESLDAVIVGVSVDGVDSHREFCAKEGLAFRLLSDTDGAVSARYGSLNERNGAKMSARNTFLIDPSGRIAQVFTAVSPATHSDDVLAALDRLRH